MRGRRWTQEDLQLLREMHQGGFSVDEMAARQGRTRGAVIVRLSDERLSLANRKLNPQCADTRAARELAMSGAWGPATKLGHIPEGTQK